MRVWIPRFVSILLLIALAASPALGQRIGGFDPNPSAPCPGQDLRCIQGAPHPIRAQNGVQRVYAVYYYDSGPMAGQYAAGCGTSWYANQNTPVGPQAFATFVTARHVLEGNDAGGHYSAVSVQLEFFYVPLPGRVCGVLGDNECHVFMADCRSPIIRQAPCWDWDANCDVGRILLTFANVPDNAQPLPLAGFDPVVGQQAWIPQHPQGRCMEWNEGPIVTTDPGCEFTHRISTQGGSSGAPVIYLGGAPEVFGVHVAANLQGGVPVCPNRAVYWSRLQVFLNTPFHSICDPTPAVPKTWGKLKTMYR